MNPLPPGAKPDPWEPPTFRVLLGDLRLVTWALGPYLGGRSLVRAVRVARFGGKGHSLLWGGSLLGGPESLATSQLGPRSQAGAAMTPLQIL